MIELTQEQFARHRQENIDGNGPRGAAGEVWSLEQLQIAYFKLQIEEPIDIACAGLWISARKLPGRPFGLSAST